MIEQQMWEERQQLIEPKEVDDTFETAKETVMDKDNAVVYVEL